MILPALGAAGSLLALLIGLRALWNTRRTPCLEDLAAAAPAHWPKVSLIVAARNEAGHVEAAARSLLAQDYPDLELIFVDDRSEDATGRILERLAAADSRLTRVTVRELPSGWLGKPHALHQAVERARGDYLLFTDADVHFAPGALRRAIALAEDRGLDHLAVGPRVQLPTLSMALVTGVIGLLLLVPLRPRGDGTLRSGPSVGIGAFNLVRRSAFARTEGFPWLRMEVGDDLGLALLLRRHGARAGFVAARTDVWLSWYASFAEMARGLEKNMFGGGLGYSYLQLGGVLLLLLLWSLGPLLGLLGALWPLAAGGFLALAAAGVLAAQRMRQPAAGAFLWPIGVLLFGYILCRSARHCHRHGGVVWRGTRYPLAELRAGRRLNWGVWR